MDKTVKATVYKISGHIPAGNYIQLPRMSSQSLGLTGRYFYLLFRPVPTKYFVVHVDVATQDGLVVRLSFSNLFKEFKSTATWLQFPFLCNPAKDSVAFFAAVGAREHIGPAPSSTRWTVLCLDLQYILSTYLSRRYSYVRSIRLCANMLVKNVFTSDIVYDPDISMADAKKRGGNVSPLPRDFGFPVQKGETWHDIYDLIRFPPEGDRKPFDSVQYTVGGIDDNVDENIENHPQRIRPHPQNVSKCVSERVSMIHKLTEPKQYHRKQLVTKELPEIEADALTVPDPSNVHIFAHPIDLEDEALASSKGPKKSTHKVSAHLHLTMGKTKCKVLEPDPIITLKHIIGFGGGTFRDALWSSDRSTVIYPCHAVIVAMRISNGHQRFFIGHTGKVSCLSMNSSGTLLASGQTGQMGVVRVWKYQGCECLAICRTHANSLYCLSFSCSGNVLCGVGKDSHGKNLVVIWNTSSVLKKREISIVAKAHTDVDVSKITISPFDETRMVSCGRDNIRLWRVKDGTLRSAPISLGDHHSMDFTDVCFDTGVQANQNPERRLIYACCRSGHVFEIDYQKMAVLHVRRLLPTATKKKDQASNKADSLQRGLVINSISISETFCVTGSDDGFLRLWPLDFAHVYLEAEHDGAVTSVNLSADGLKILAGTSTGNLGILDVATRDYTTIMRSHTSRIMSAAMDPFSKHLATVSKDHSIRVWDAETFQQLYDFSAPNESPSTISYHPINQIFACGFESGAVRVFDVESTCLIAEHKPHRGALTGVVFSPNGEYLYSACSQGMLAAYCAADSKFSIIRVLANTVARGMHFAPDALAVSSCGRKLAFVGPSDFIVTVMDAKYLSELLRVDITSMASGDVGQGGLDTAVRVMFTPASVGHLLVATSSNRLVKLDAASGKLFAEVNNIHRSGCSSLAISCNGNYLVTSGDKVLKVWDYHMHLDINFQVFIGHSETASKVFFTPDERSIISAGEAVYIWNNLAVRPVTSHEDWKIDADKMSALDAMFVDNTSTDMPRHTPPRPMLAPSLSTRIEDLSSIHGGDLDLKSLLSEEDMPMGSPDAGKVGWEGSSQNVPLSHEKNYVFESPVKDTLNECAQKFGEVSLNRVKSTKFEKHSPHKPKTQTSHVRTLEEKPQKVTTMEKTPEAIAPSCSRHFKATIKSHAMARRRYTAPPHQAGLRLSFVIGYNGNGRDNMIWCPDTGLFAYTSGSIVVVEDLNTGQQTHLQGHQEEVSTLAVQNDCRVIASASGSFGQFSSCQVCVWDVADAVCKKVLNPHHHQVVCMAYSRDDRFLLTVGDYHESKVIVWSTHTYTMLTSSKTAAPIHCIKWDPTAVNEFATVGEDGSLCFWLLDETDSEAGLSVHEAEVPDELLNQEMDGEVAFTNLEYTCDSTLFVSATNGKVSAWDTRHNSCYMHWDADTAEIGILLVGTGGLITASSSGNVRLWSVKGVEQMREPGHAGRAPAGRGLVMEDEMTLDGVVTAARFDENLEMGIVGTSAGTLWYINWTERTSIRLISGHGKKVTAIAMTTGGLMATGSEDGSLRVWVLQNKEQALQFQVKDQKCSSVAFAPAIQQHAKFQNSADATAQGQVVPPLAAGYSDGTVRVFDVNSVQMQLKLRPHSAAVTVIRFSSDGSLILSGASDGLIAISSPTSGMTVRVISDHQGAPITDIDVAPLQIDDGDHKFQSAQLWLACSGDRRVSIWSSDWGRDVCDPIDWLTFPAPACTPEGEPIKGKTPYSVLPLSLARFSPEEPDIIVYTGYGMNKGIQFYSLSHRRVMRTMSLTHWACCFDLSPVSPLIAVGVRERVLKLMDYYEGSFQDFASHDNAVSLARYTLDGTRLVTAAHGQILVWDVLI
ncbi:WD repeat-containing protein 90-like isoform X3 [Pomacea canaliculata]|nr:WD repeat-containing protein 90-like isoform X3 [Pomacea canaliculata]